jgi:hypothetical protein
MPGKPSPPKSPAKVWLRRTAANIIRRPHFYWQKFRRHGLDRLPEPKTFDIALHKSFGATSVRIRLSIPKMPRGAFYAFLDHDRDEHGNTTDRVLAGAVGAFAISDDLGETWRSVRVRGYGRFIITNARMLPTGEVLLQALDPEERVPPPDQVSHLLVCDLNGRVLSSTEIDGARWHGCRSVDVSGGTVMYAEYTPNRGGRKAGPHRASRVLRSRDFGRTWHVVHTEDNIRHFHFLQAKPGTPGEWWLTSGDDDPECHIWRSTDDGDTWVDQTAAFGERIVTDNLRLSRRMFRLTDLAWDGDDIIWGTDDRLTATTGRGRDRAVSKPGSRLFRGNLQSGIAPTDLGLCGPEVRNLIAIGDFYLVLTQVSTGAPDSAPQVWLMPKRTPAEGPTLQHLFDIERLEGGYAGFTFSRASRADRNGVFFTYRPPKQVFNASAQILRWEIEIR